MQEEINKYIEKYNSIIKNINILHQDALRLEGIITYLKEKDKENNLTNS